MKSTHFTQGELIVPGEESYSVSLNDNSQSTKIIKSRAFTIGFFKSGKLISANGHDFQQMRRKQETEFVYWPLGLNIVVLLSSILP